MKHLFNIKVHPFIIVMFLSPLFWFLLVILIYGLLMFYWIHKMFFVTDNHVNTHEAIVTGVCLKFNAYIWRKKRLNIFYNQVKPFAKR